MATLQIRDLPDDVYTSLARRAARERRSLAQQAVVDLARITRTDATNRRLEVLGALREALAQSGPRELPVAPETLVREDRDR